MGSMGIIRKAFNVIKAQGFKFFIYVAIYLAISAVISYIPKVSFIALFLQLFLSYGFAKEIVNLYNGKNESYFGFVKNGFENWLLVLKCRLLVLVRSLVGIIMILGGAYMFVIALLSQFFRTGPGMAGNSDFLLSPYAIILGLVLLIAGVIFIFMVSLKYAFVDFVMMDNEEKTAGEILFEAKRLSQGRCGTIFSILFVIALLIGIAELIIGLIIGALNINLGTTEFMNMKTSVTSLLVNCIASLIGVPLITCSLYELYQMCGGKKHDEYIHKEEEQQMQIPNVIVEDNSNNE